MKLSIPRYAEKIIERLEGCGYEALIVGGCVRDALLGRIPGDFDITTSAPPDATLEIFSSDGFSAVPTGIAHGTVTVIYEKNAAEVTTYRIDGEYSDFRHPAAVKFTPSLEEDLKRRDFTVNAMAYSHKLGLVDLHGGIADLENRIIRAVGDPYKRFFEDALRIIRGIRFCSVLDFSMDGDTKAAAAALSANLSEISRERVSGELSKLLMGKASAKVLRDFLEIIGGVMGLSGNIAADFSLLTELSAELFVRLTALCHDLSAEEIRGRLRALRFDGETVNLSACLAENRGCKISDYTAAKQLCRKVGIRAARGVAMLRIAEGTEDLRVLEYFRDIEARGECVSLKNLAVNGRDLMELGIDGKALGEVLEHLLDSVIEKKVNNEFAELTAWAVKYKNHKDGQI